MRILCPSDREDPLSHFSLIQLNLGDEGWKRLTACLDFGIFNGPKENSNSGPLFWVFQADKPLQLIDQAAEFTFEYQFEPLQVIWQSLLKAIQEDIRGILMQNQ